MKRLSFMAADFSRKKCEGFLGLWFREKGVIDRTAERESEREELWRLIFLGREGRYTGFLKKQKY